MESADRCCKLPFFVAFGFLDQVLNLSHWLVGVALDLVQWCLPNAKDEKGSYLNISFLLRAMFLSLIFIFWKNGFVSSTCLLILMLAAMLLAFSLSLSWTGLFIINNLAYSESCSSNLTCFWGGGKSFELISCVYFDMNLFKLLFFSTIFHRVF